MGRPIESVDLGFSWTDDPNLLCKKLILQHKWSSKLYKTGEYVFPISPNNKSLFEPLLDLIQITVENIYPKIDIQSRTAWVYVSNAKRNQMTWHYHMPEHVQRDISTVFYMKKPADGAIAFVDYIHEPHEGELIIFPATAPHTPLPTTSDEYRIALNVNLVTRNKYLDFMHR
tara:strand:- start:29 stop:544 length:516 start_codon:yes stop_codon:yes gene_type:complete